MVYILNSPSRMNMKQGHLQKEKKLRVFTAKRHALNKVLKKLYYRKENHRKRLGWNIMKKDRHEDESTSSLFA